MVTPPVIFSDKAKITAIGGGYPVQISAADLDKNFTFATTDFQKYDEAGNEQPWIVNQIVGPGGHTQRQLVFNPSAPSSGSCFFCVQDGTLTWFSAPSSGTHVLGAVNGDLTWSPAPSSGTHVLGVVDGVLQWISTEEC